MRSPTVSTLLMPAIALALVATLAGCRSDDPAREAATDTQSSSETAGPEGQEAVTQADITAALRTVRSFLAVKSRAGDRVSVRIDEQEQYLTDRDVQPVLEEAYPDPLGWEDKDVAIELSDARADGDVITVDFERVSQAISYAFIDGEMEDEGSPATSTWSGTATLEHVDGTWLINDLATDVASGGS